MFTEKNQMRQLINKNKLIFSMEAKIVKDVFTKGLKKMENWIFIIINI